MAAEYILKEGNERVLLCERGIRTFETAYRFTLDLTAIPVLKELSHLPVIVDPTHAAGRRDLVEPLIARRGRGGRRRHHRRGPPAARGGDLRRAAAAARLASSPTTPTASSRPRRSPARVALRRRGVNVAVVGVGLIGGSIGLAARDRLGARSRARARRARRRGMEPGVDAAPAGEALDGADVAFVAAPLGVLRRRRRRGARGRVGRLRGERRRLGEGPAAARRRALLRRSPARRLGAAGTRACARRPVRRCDLVPHAHQQHRGHPARAPAPA